MTDDQKKTLRSSMDKLVDMLYDNMIKAVEQAEAVFPPEADDSMKEKIVSQVMEDAFNTQMEVLKSGFAKASEKLKDKDYMQEVIKNVR